MKNRLSAAWRRSALAGAALGLMAAGTLAQAADVVNLGALRFTSHSAGYIAYEKGYFKEQGIDLKFKFFQAAQPVAVAIASGDVDFGVTALTGGFFNLAGKGALQVIGGVWHEEKGMAGSAILVSNKAYDAGFTTVDQFPGKSIGITQLGSSFHYMAGQIAEAKGFDFKEIKLKPLQKVGAIIAALKSGQVDSFIIAPHIAKGLVKAGAAKQIGWLYDYAPYQVTTVFTSTQNTKEKSDLVSRFMKAYGRGVADFRRVMLDQEKDPAATEAMTKLIHKYVYASRPYEKAAPSIKSGAINLNAGNALDVGDVDKQLKWFQAQKLVASGFSARDIVDVRFVQAYNLPN